MQYSGLSLEGKVVLVTGAARGIGSALAVGLAQAGADVAVTDLPELLGQAEEPRGQIEALGRSSRTYPLDVRDLEGIGASVDRVVQDFGHLDILVNNAGIRRRKPALEVTEDDWDAVIDTNLKGVFFCSQAAARHMIEQGGGSIISIASQLAIVARENRAAYCASKGGVANLTRALALEWIGYGITVNAIGPGPTETPGLLEAESLGPDEVQQDLAGHMPLGRRMRPEELVGAAVYLASPSARATTGHLLIVDGGWTAV
jgi:NAD(P)-dependent dehydrogenase (short-subunit alcohol dehydrogenase family)